MSAYAPEPRRGRTAVAVLLAVALLAVVGAVAGYLFGVRARDKARVATADTSTGAGKQCPQFVQRDAAARGAVLPLTERLHIETKKPGATGANDPFESEVWICVAASAPPGKTRLWYQGHGVQKDLYPAEPVVNDPVAGNGMLLNPVNSIEDGKYRATYTDNKGKSTTYTVSTKELDVDLPVGHRTEVVVFVED